MTLCIWLYKKKLSICNIILKYVIPNSYIIGVFKCRIKMRQPYIFVAIMKNEFKILTVTVSYLQNLVFIKIL